MKECYLKKNNLKQNNNYNNLTVVFIENNLKLEGMYMIEGEKYICKNILNGNIDLKEYKKAVLSLHG